MACGCKKKKNNPKQDKEIKSAQQSYVDKVAEIRKKFGLPN